MKCFNPFRVCKCLCFALSQVPSAVTGNSELHGTKGDGSKASLEMAVAAPGFPGQGDDSSFPSDLSPQSTSPLPVLHLLLVSGIWHCFPNLRAASPSPLWPSQALSLTCCSSEWLQKWPLPVTCCQVIQTLDSSTPNPNPLEVHAGMKCTLSCLMA